LPDDCLEALDAKRRQLDDSIWKYIASKEREYKLYEKEVKQKRRQETEKRRRHTAERENADAQVELGNDRVNVAGGSNVVGGDGRETMDRTSITGLKDRRASLERDKDFVGVFTPTFLPALSNEDVPPVPLERTSSTPDQLPSRFLEPLGPSAIKRTNSDSIVSNKKSSRPSQLALQHRTSSSGSSVDGRLTSAMKSPTQRPKRKRVSLAVGDAIVAPSDNVPGSLSNNSTPSHSRIRPAAPDRFTSTSSRDILPPAAMTATTSVAAALVQAEQTAIMNATNHAENQQTVINLPATTLNGTSKTSTASPSKSRIDPDGDLFDLDGEDDTELPPPILEHDDLDESAVEEDDELNDRLASLATTSNPINTPPRGERYESTAGLIPNDKRSPDNTVSLLGTSAVSSQQPTQPGFRRPSVVRDPVFQGPDYAVAEKVAVEDDVYGSSYNRPNKGSFTAASLGGSYMEKNAEEMMRLRGERQRTAQVRS